MFIHFGLYSLPARGEWILYQEQIPPQEYNRLAEKFNPTRYRPEEWADLARKAGMKYMVMGTKHHDGFALFDSKVSNFTSVKTAAQRDLIADYVKACRKAGLKVGLYFSLPDWQWPAFFKGPKKDPKGWEQYRRFVHAQVRELCTQYGKIDLLWYDTMTPNTQKAPYTAEDWGAREMNAMVRRHQPHIIINNRSGLPEDYDTPEQRVVASKPGRPWEACMTMNWHWGYFKHDDLWKPVREIVHHLTACAFQDGNYLLNIGPRPDGSIPQPNVTRLTETGQWLKRNGDAIYGAGRCDFPGATYGVATARGKRIYMIVHWWPGRELKVPEACVDVKSAWILSTRQKVRFERRGQDLFFYDLPARPPDPIGTVIALEIH